MDGEVAINPRRVNRGGNGGVEDSGRKKSKNMDIGGREGLSIFFSGGGGEGREWISPTCATQR